MEQTAASGGQGRPHSGESAQPAEEGRGHEVGPGEQADGRRAAGQVSQEGKDTEAILPLAQIQPGKDTEAILPLAQIQPGKDTEAILPLAQIQPGKDTEAILPLVVVGLSPVQNTFASDSAEPAKLPP